LPVPELYQVLCALGDAIARGASVATLMPAFDLGALGALGFMPEFDACARCGAPLGKRPLAGGRARLSPDAGGLVCASCFERELAQQTRAGIINLTTVELTTLREMRAMSMSVLMGSAGELVSLPPERLKQLTRATHAFIEHHLGRSSRALKASVHNTPTPRRQATARA
jgi:recombinational DNA repair protein (RecF pathway)